MIGTVGTRRPSVLGTKHISNPVFGGVLKQGKRQRLKQGKRQRLKRASDGKLYDLWFMIDSLCSGHFLGILEGLETNYKLGLNFVRVCWIRGVFFPQSKTHLESSIQKVLGSDSKTRLESRCCAILIDNMLEAGPTQHLDSRRTCPPAMRLMGDRKGASGGTDSRM